MNIKYITDDSGKRSAVIVPLEEWKSIKATIHTLREDLERLSPEDEIERRDAYEEMQRGETLNLQEAIKNW
jgi:PHD/YefM family antitoxin component YafN of YafNO toxin-antitoxin module